ncbi:hypothetical protein Q3G72_029258 [Acer saccharum]|nr:hypothetical protein Q3G72_029258 [Acer saccharum]
MATTQISKKRKFVAELNKVLTRELAEDGYSVVKAFRRTLYMRSKHGHTVRVIAYAAAMLECRRAERRPETVTFVRDFVSA